MLKPVGNDQVTLALLEALGDTKLSELPEVFQHAYVALRGELKTTLSILRDLGFVIAKETGEPQFSDVAEVVSIFSAGRHHAPGTMAAFAEAWPVLHEALSNLVDNIDMGSEAASDAQA
jgi:hypothetical protein